MGSVNRKTYLTSMFLDQDFLDEAHDALVNQIELICDIEAPDGSFIRASNRNKYVGGVFYEALLNFPQIQRTLGDYLTAEITFSEIKLEISNSDGRFSEYLPGGVNYSSWINRAVTVKIGLRDVEATYFTVFSGTVTETAGFGRTMNTIVIAARDKYDKINNNFPVNTFKESEFPDLPDELIGTFKPVIYGDWTTSVTLPFGSVPCFVVNARDPLVDTSREQNVTVQIGVNDVFTLERHALKNNDSIRLSSTDTLPSAYNDAQDYFVQVINANSFSLSAISGPGALLGSLSEGSGVIRLISSIGDGGAPLVRNVKLVISDNALQSLDLNEIWLVRGLVNVRIATADIANVSGNNNTFEVVQNTGATLVEGENYLFIEGDEFYVKVIGKNIGAGLSDNVVKQARDILETYTTVTAGDFGASWGTYQAKASPAQDAVANIKSRVWIRDQQPCLDYILSLLEQVRLEVSTDNTGDLTITSLHFSDFATLHAANTFVVRAFDIERESLALEIDDRNNFNRAVAGYAFLPDRSENGFKTDILRNQQSIDATEKTISKEVSFPNLYIRSDATAQLTEILKITSAFFEIITFNATWRSILKNPGDMIKLNFVLSTSVFENVPCLIRDVTYEPNNLKVTFKVWSFQLMPFAGWTPSYAGIVGGDTATIVSE